MEAMATTTDIGRMIDRQPGVHGGRPCVAGTSVSVRRIAVLHNTGEAPEEIAANVGYLSLAQVHAALAYYYANKSEIDADLEAEEREYDLLAEQHPRRGAVSQIQIYIDEDAGRRGLIHALRSRCLTVLTALKAGLTGMRDEQQSALRGERQCVLYCTMPPIFTGYTPNGSAPGVSSRNDPGTATAFLRR